MADFTKDGVTISPGSGSVGTTELKVKVANPPYQEFYQKAVDFTIIESTKNVSVNLKVNLPFVSVWKDNTTSLNPEITISKDPSDLTFTINGKGNILSTRTGGNTPITIGADGSSQEVVLKTLKIYIPSKSKDPVLELNNFNLGLEGLKKDLTSAEFNWPDKEWIDTQDSPVYDFRIEGEVEPNLSGSMRIGILVFEGYQTDE